AVTRSSWKRLMGGSHFLLNFALVHKMMNMRKFLFAGLAITGLLLLTSLKALAQEAGAVQWLTFEEAVEKSKTEKRKIFIDVYTDWCGWCKVMDKKTFSEPAVAK